MVILKCCITKKFTKNIGKILGKYVMSVFLLL